MKTIAEQFYGYGVVPVVVLEDVKDALPLAAALVHDMVGMTLVALLAAGAGAAHFWPMVAVTVLCELGLMAVYYLVTYGECRRILLGTNAEERA